MADLFSNTEAQAPAPTASSDFQPYPWKVGLAEYKSLECELECTTRLVKLAEKLTDRLSDGTKYGHVAAWLYGTWAKRVGRTDVELYWQQYDAWRKAEALRIRTADDAGYDDEIPF